MLVEVPVRIRALAGAQRCALSLYLPPEVLPVAALLCRGEDIAAIM